MNFCFSAVDVMMALMFYREPLMTDEPGLPQDKEPETFDPGSRPEASSEEPSP